MAASAAPPRPRHSPHGSGVRRALRPKALASARPAGQRQQCSVRERTPVLSAEAVEDFGGAARDLTRAKAPLTKKEAGGQSRVLLAALSGAKPRRPFHATSRPLQFRAVGIAPSCDFKTAVSLTRPAGRSLNRTYLLGPPPASVITYGPRSTGSRGSRGEAASRNCTASLRA